MSGKYYEDLTPDQIIQHTLGRTISEADNLLFNGMTMNTQPLHLSEGFASRTDFGQRIVNGILTLRVVIGITVAEQTEGAIVANLGYEAAKHPRPVFHGDTIYVETEVLDKRESRSDPARGIVRLRHLGKNSAGRWSAR